VIITLTKPGSGAHKKKTQQQQQKYHHHHHDKSEAGPRWEHCALNNFICPEQLY
jgi:hypothetical protein